MIIAQPENKMLLRLLSLLLAVLIFLFIMSETDGEQTVSVPVDYANLPAGLMLDSPLPASVKVTISGPRILLLKARLVGIKLHLDLQGLHPGLNRFVDLERFISLDHQVHAKAALPALDVHIGSKF